MSGSIENPPLGHKPIIVNGKQNTANLSIASMMAYSDSNERRIYMLKLVHKRAIRLLVDKNLPISDVADMLDVSTETVKDWQKRPEFKEALEERAKQVDDAGADWRIVRAKMALTNIWDEIQLRLSDPKKIGKVPTKTLAQMIIRMQNELRLDTPGAATQKVQHSELSDLKERHKTSKSQEIIKGGKFGTLIEFPKKEESK